MTYVMWDTATPAAIPHGGPACDATAGYDRWSRYPSSAEIRRRVPDKPHLVICTAADRDAMCLDVEPRYAQPHEAPAWVDRQHARGLVWPVVYCMASWTQQVRNALGGRRYILWSAHYRVGPHICGACGYPPADATQWADKGPFGENVDQSLLSDRFWTHVFGQNVEGDDMPLNDADKAYIHDVIVDVLRASEFHESRVDETRRLVHSVVVDVLRSPEFDVAGRLARIETVLMQP